jgi:intracellular septation protein A
MLATATDNAVIVFAFAAFLFLCSAIYKLVRSPAPENKWDALLPAGLFLMTVAFIIIYNSVP